VLFRSNRRIELIHAPGGCPISADAEALALALHNLVDNALKYSPDQSTVVVEWGCDGNTVVIRVRDRGMGIPAAEQKMIFQKFVRGRAAIAAHVKGTGIGLAIVSHIVKAHGGEVRVESEPGQGSTFTIELNAVGADPRVGPNRG
jgi:signal transduction histidine kinase